MQPFQRVIVDYVVEGGTRVTWFLERLFVDPLPHSFQLQFAETSTPTADDWADVGLPVSNGFFAIDDEKRLWGKSLEVHYRVVLTTPVNTYTSDPASVLSDVPYRDWLDIREQYRQYKKVLAKYKGTAGYLLKRKRFGRPCQTCLDPLTQEGMRSNCPECFGTEITAGYYKAVPDFYVDMATQSAREMTNLQGRATVKDVVLPGLCPGDVLVNSRDVFVEKNSGRRHNIETVGTESEFRAYPICLKLELRQIPFSDVIYRVDLQQGS
jgi:hypothetical protein